MIVVTGKLDGVGVSALETDGTSVLVAVDVSTEHPFSSVKTNSEHRSRL